MRVQKDICIGARLKDLAQRPAKVLHALFPTLFWKLFLHRYLKNESKFWCTPAVIMCGSLGSYTDQQVSRREAIYYLGRTMARMLIVDTAEPKWTTLERVIVHCMVGFPELCRNFIYTSHFGFFIFIFFFKRSFVA